MIKPEIIDRIREQTDIVKIINEYVPLKKAGRYYRALCPFHSEQTPSFYVSPEKQIYHCFGCGAGGSVYNFLMQYEKISFVEAIKKLASKLNIVLEIEKIPNQYQPLLDVYEYATNLYQSNLTKSNIALEYLKKRRLNPEIIKRFRLGYAPSGNILYGNAKHHGFSEEVLIKAGLIIKKEDGCYDWFFDRIIFPVFSLSGKVIAFTGRSLDDTREPKYLNSPETPLFRKGECLYGLYQAKNYLYQNIPILVEGNFDLLSLVNAGINNVVAPLGTAFTKEHALILNRFGKQLMVAFDGDASGRNATLRILEILLKNGLNPQIIFLPDGFDPDKFINTYGKESWEKLVQANIDFIDFLLKITDTRSIANKQNCLKTILNLIALIDDKINQELYINKTAEVFAISKEILLKQIANSLKKKEFNEKPSRKYSIPLIEQQILSCLLTTPAYIKIAQDELPYTCFASPDVQLIIQKIYQTVDNTSAVAKLIDEIDEPELKQLIIDLSFRSNIIPSEKEFIRKLKILKANWLLKEMQKAKEQGNETLLQQLSMEHYNLKKNLSQRKR
ncbi:MAG: DNA primase [candidate division WOR-3 bacterium]